MSQNGPRAHIVVLGNEKGGAGKSTIAIHIATALLHGGARLALIDLDLRQQSMAHFFRNRARWAEANGVELPMPSLPVEAEEAKALAAVKEPAEAKAMFEALLARAAEDADFVLIDTPGADTLLSRVAHAKADRIITPMNDSFVDFDMLGEVDPVSLDLVRPSLYSEAVWEARKQKMVFERASVDWIVLRNRLATAEARNRKRLEERIEVLSKKVGFRVGPGMRDRVIYRELFPFGLTIADLGPGVKPVAVSVTHIAARQELRALMQSTGLAEQLDIIKGRHAAANGGGPARVAAPAAARQPVL